MRRAGASALALTLTTLALASGAARAQDLAGQGPGSFDLELLRPGLDRNAILDVESGAIGDGVDAAVWINATLDPLQESFPLPSGKRVAQSIVTDRVSAHLVGSWALGHSFALGAEVPVVLWQDGAAFSPGLLAKNKIAAVALDDVRLVPKYAFLQERDHDALDLAIAAHITLPTSFPRQEYVGDGLPTVTPEVELSKKLGDLRIAADLDALLRAPSTFGLGQQGEEIAGRIGASYSLGIVDVAASVNQAVIVYPTVLSKNNNPGEALLGITAHVGDLDIFGAVGTAIAGAPGVPLARALAGVRTSFGAPGASSSTSAQSQSDASATAAAVGDKDGDGVPDAQDRCPNDAGPAATKGCPDHDGDGVPDIDDKCYAVAGRADHAGCPYTALEDRDGDGIPNELDKCPDQAEDFDGVRDDDGCPGEDEDNDGIPDNVDKCPNDPETYNGVDDGDGCPDTGPVTVTLDGDKLGFSEKLSLDAKNVLSANSQLELDAVANLMKNHTEIKKLRIGGHSEVSTKKRDPNLVSTQQHADAVKAYLVKKGVARDRLEAVGYGGSLPLDKTGGAAAKDTNRRVELTVVERG
ncbi:MAG TPA: OmpA family protein [Myxococcota bacterium]